HVDRTTVLHDDLFHDGETETSTAGRMSDIRIEDRGAQGEGNAWPVVVDVEYDPFFAGRLHADDDFARLPLVGGRARGVVDQIDQPAAEHLAIEPHGQSRLARELEGDGEALPLLRAELLLAALGAQKIEQVVGR